MKILTLINPEEGGNEIDFKIAELMHHSFSSKKILSEGAPVMSGVPHVQRKARKKDPCIQRFARQGTGW
jgi:hypothetical protein